MSPKTVIGPELTLGPVLFHWPEEKWRDFYFKMADEAPIDTVFIGETVCAKRAAFTIDLYDAVTERLEKAGKKIVFSTLGEVAVPIDRKLVKSVCSMETHLVEANDASALWHLSGKPHAVGQLLNVYNEDALVTLAARGAQRFCLPSEMPSASIAVMAEAAKKHDAMVEVQVFGRTSLALSARCYHARAHGRIKDNCQFVCEKDPDGMDLKTLSGQTFLTVNGIQTLSYTCLNLLHEMADMKQVGVHAFRLSPHSTGMVQTARLFRDVMMGNSSAETATEKLASLYPSMPMSNGFYHRKPGHEWVAA